MIFNFLNKALFSKIKSTVIHYFSQSILLNKTKKGNCMKLITLIGWLFASVLLSSCSSRSIMPDSKEVEVSRKAADEDCKDMGLITGTTTSIKGTKEDALADLKQTAANKGANYVVVKQYSAQGTSVTGLAYECP